MLISVATSTKDQLRDLYESSECCLVLPDFALF